MPIPTPADIQSAWQSVLQQLSRLRRTKLNTIRDHFQADVKGAVEYVRCNGRVYRYGVMSNDAPRTLMLLKAMYNNDFNLFCEDLMAFPSWHSDVTGIYPSSWQDVDVITLKQFLQRHYTAAFHERLPAPLGRMDDMSRMWLCAEYGDVARIPAAWGMVDSWEELDYCDSTAQRMEVERITKSNMDDINIALANITEAIAKPDSDVYFDTLKDEVWSSDRQQTLQTQFPHHGPVELAVATVATPASVNEWFVVMLLTLRKVSPAATTTTPSWDMVTELYKLWPERSVSEEWPDGPTSLPACTTPTVAEFAALVKDIAACEEQ